MYKPNKKKSCPIFTFFPQISLLPAISQSVQADLVGTALGIVSVSAGVFSGLSTLGVGKLLHYLKEEYKSHIMDSWTVVMMLLMGVAAISALTSIQPALSDIRKVLCRLYVIIITPLLIFLIQKLIVKTSQIPQEKKTNTRKSGFYKKTNTQFHVSQSAPLYYTPFPASYNDYNNAKYIMTSRYYH